VLAEDGDPIALSLVLTALANFNPGNAKELAENLSSQGDMANHWLLSEVIGEVLYGRRRVVDDVVDSGVSYSLSIPNGDGQTMHFTKPYVTIGSAAGNDIVIPNPLVAGFHVTIQRRADELRLLCSDGAAVFIDGEPVASQSAELKPGAHVSFTGSAELGPVLTVDWDDAGGSFVTESVSTVARLIALSRTDALGHLDLPAIARLATKSQLRRYALGGYLCREGGEASRVFFLQAGAADVLHMLGGVPMPTRQLTEGDSFGAFSSEQPYPASVRVTSDAAIVLAVDAAAQPAAGRRAPRAIPELAG